MRHEEQPVVVVLGAEDTRSLVADALVDQEIRLEWLREPAALGAGDLEPDAVLVDRDLLEGPGTVSEWLERGRLGPAVPLLLVARRAPDAAHLAEWLRAGVWDLVSVPIDARLLGLRIRNLVGHRRRLPGRTWILPNRPYSWTGLVRATDEALALSRRHDRPISCVAIAVHDESTGPPDARTRLLHRLAVATQEWVRGSDLVGVSDSGIILAVLPDTPPEEAQFLATRLVATLDRRLRQWSVLARLEAHHSSPRPDQLASEFLLQATRATS
jgi:hypothetical protein